VISDSCYDVPIRQPSLQKPRSSGLPVASDAKWRYIRQSRGCILNHCDDKINKPWKNYCVLSLSILKEHVRMNMSRNSFAANCCGRCSKLHTVYIITSYWIYCSIVGFIATRVHNDPLHDPEVQFDLLFRAFSPARSSWWFWGFISFPYVPLLLDRD